MTAGVHLELDVLALLSALCAKCPLVVVDGGGGEHGCQQWQKLGRLQHVNKTWR